MDIVRVGGDGLIEGVDGFADTPEFLEAMGAEVGSVSHVRSNLEDSLANGECFLVFLLDVKNGGFVEESIGIVGLDFEGAVDPRESLVDVPCTQMIVGASFFVGK